MFWTATRFAPVGLVNPMLDSCGTLIWWRAPVVRSISMAMSWPSLNSACRPSPDHATSPAGFIGADPAPRPGHVVMTYRAPSGDTSDRVALPPLGAGGVDAGCEYAAESLCTRNQPGPTWSHGTCARVPT